MEPHFRKENRVISKRSAQAVQKHIPGCMKSTEEGNLLFLDHGWNGGIYDANIMINNALQFGLPMRFTGEILKACELAKNIYVLVSSAAMGW